MDDERREDIRRWRDAWLFKMYGDEGAATRLAKEGPIPDVIERALAIDPIPEMSEREAPDFDGHPLNPLHGWWGYQGPSSMEISARKRGLPWPPLERDD